MSVEIVTVLTLRCDCRLCAKLYNGPLTHTIEGKDALECLKQAKQTWVFAHGENKGKCFYLTHILPENTED